MSSNRTKIPRRGSAGPCGSPRRAIAAEPLDVVDGRPNCKTIVPLERQYYGRPGALTGTKPMAALLRQLPSGATECPIRAAKLGFGRAHPRFTASEVAFRAALSTTDWPAPPPRLPIDVRQPARDSSDRLELWPRQMPRESFTAPAFFSS